MITKSVIQDFPKSKLKSLIDEADNILVLQSPELSFSIMTESFSAGLRRYLDFSFIDSTQKPLLTLCTNFEMFFEKSRVFDQIINYQHYLDFLKQKQKEKKSTLLIDFSNDSKQNFFFEFNRMTKWPVLQKPYFSKLVFHWQNLPHGEKEDNILSCRYLSLFEQIIGRDFFSKPRFPKIYLDEEANQNLYQKLFKKYNFSDYHKYLPIALLYSENEINYLENNSFWTVIDSLIKKRANLEINIILDKNIQNQRKIKDEVAKRKIFSLLRPRELRLIEEDLLGNLAILRNQKLFISPDHELIHLANALGVKTISLRGPSSKHFVSNYRLDNPFYPHIETCEFLSKTTSYQGKGYLAPCLKDKKCSNDSHCLDQIDFEELVKKACQII